MPSVLERIVAHKRHEVAARKAIRPTVALADAPPPRDFVGALRRSTVALIAEVKQASPSRGVMREAFDPVELSVCFAENGAACLSVLTDEEFFRGHDRYLEAARDAVDIPVLRKEFLIDPWQVDESRALGADAVLLIAAILSTEELQEFRSRAHSLGMAALVEVHNERELEAALAADARLLGINNRNLHTFETALETTERLAARLPLEGRLLVSESGIYTRADVERVAQCGARAILVGEALVREGEPARLVRELSTVPAA
jgi:indole-3-glycerol phosphate synthase